MSWKKVMHEVEVVITGLCILKKTKATGKDVEIWFVKSDGCNPHLPMLTYRLDNYLGPVPENPVDVYPDAEGNLIGQIPLSGDLMIGPAGAPAADPSLASRTSLARPGALDFSLDYLCGADEDMKLVLNEPSKFVLYTAKFKGGQIVTRKPVAAVDGEIPRWRRPALADETVLAEQIVWRTRTTSKLEVKELKKNGLIYEFGRTSFICLALSNLPETAKPGSPSKNFEHWEMFAKDIGQEKTYEPPQQAAGGISHGSSSCPPTGGG